MVSHQAILENSYENYFQYIVTYKLMLIKLANWLNRNDICYITRLYNRKNDQPFCMEEVIL